MITTHHSTPKEEAEQQLINALTKQGSNVAGANRVLATLKARYNVPIRYYHTFEHAQAVASHVLDQKQFATHLDAVLTAAWFHDVVYWSMPDIDNELASSRFARHTLYLAGCTVGFSNLVGDLIMDTQHGNRRPDSIDGQILADADLVSLAAARSNHIINLQNIRKEYLHIPLHEFCEGHRRIMEQLQQRPHIFWTDHMAEQYEMAARSNIDWVITCLNKRCQDLFPQ